jgi:hypothetical protein
MRIACSRWRFATYRARRNATDIAVQQHAVQQLQDLIRIVPNAGTVSRRAARNDERHAGQRAFIDVPVRIWRDG